MTTKTSGQSINELSPGQFLKIGKVIPAGSLEVRKLASGAVTFYWRVTINGKTAREVIGVYDPSAPPKSLQHTRTVKGGQAATAATVGLGALQAVQDGIAPARDSLQMLVPYLDVAKWLLLTITLIGLGVMIWARIDDHRKGLR